MQTLDGIAGYIRFAAAGFFRTLAALLRSRKYLTLLSGLFALIIVALIPRLAPYYELLFTFILLASLTTIGGIAYEDAAETTKQTLPPAVGTPADEIIKTIVDELIKDGGNPLGEEHRAKVTTTVESQLVSKPAPN